MRVMKSNGPIARHRLHHPCRAVFVVNVTTYPSSALQSRSTTRSRLALTPSNSPRCADRIDDPICGGVRAQNNLRPRRRQPHHDGTFARCDPRAPGWHEEGREARLSDCAATMNGRAPKCRPQVQKRISAPNTCTYTRRSAASAAPALGRRRAREWPLADQCCPRAARFRARGRRVRRWGGVAI